MTTAQVYARFQAIYKEPSSRFYDTVWAVELINDSVDDIETEIAPLNPAFFGVKVGNLGLPSVNGGYVADTQEYVLPVTFRKVVEVVVKDLGGPPYRRLEEVRYDQRNVFIGGEAAAWMSGGGRGEPVFYYVYMPDASLTAVAVPKIGFVPIPTRSGGVAGVEVSYHASRDVVAVIDGSTYPDISPDWHPLIPWKMAMNAAAVDESPRFSYYQAQYQGRLARLLGEGMRGQGEGQERVEVVDDD